MRLPGGRQAQPGVATGHNILAWRLGYAEVFLSKTSASAKGKAAEAALIFCILEPQFNPAALHHHRSAD